MEDIGHMAMRDQLKDTAEQDDGLADDQPDSGFESLTGIRHPTDPIAVIMPGKKAAIRSWGLTAPGLDHPVINARLETLTEKPTFRPLLDRRCLIPATGWYEWRKDSTGKHKNRITLPDHQPFFFAGLENGRAATVITCAPSGSIAHIHSRMPVVLGPNHLGDWLDPMRGFNDLRELLGPLPDHVLAWHEETPVPNKSDHAETQIDLFAK
jgi:putative SOS response-associated peptidase YedK